MKIHLFHGGLVPVESPDLSKANPKRDFGAGFYTTTSEEQAVRFSRIVACRNHAWHGYVSVYEFDDSDKLNKRYFSSADSEWLDYVLANRGHLQHGETTYIEDVVIGLVANDQVGQTLNLLMIGVYGDPTSETARSFALNLLRTEKLSNQWVLKTSLSIETLNYLESHQYELS